MRENPNDLPVVALDPLADIVAMVEFEGKRYAVSAINAVGYNRSLEVLQAINEGRTPDPGALFGMARSLVKTMPPEVSERLEARQAVAILLAATRQVEQVEKLFPKEKAPGTSRPTSRRRTR